MKLITVFFVLSLILAAFTERIAGAVDDEECSLEESHSGRNHSGDWVFTFGTNNLFHALYSEEAGVIAIFDHANNMACFFSGDGAAFFVYFEANYAIYVPQQASDRTWYRSRQPPQTYLKDTLSLKELALDSVKIGIQFRADSISRSTSAKLGKILDSLSADYGSQCRAFAIVLGVAANYARELRTSLAGLERTIDRGEFNIRGDFKWLVGVHEAFGNFVGHIGGMNALAEKRIKLDYKKMLNEPSGIHVLVYFLETLRPHFDLGRSLGATLNNENLFFDLVSELSGDAYYNLDGLLYVISEIVNFIYERNSLVNVKIALQFFSNYPNADVAGLREKWRSGVRYLLESLKELNLNAQFPGLVRTLSDILGGKWFCETVNMSKLVESVLDIKLSGNITQSVELILNPLEDVMKQWKFAANVTSYSLTLL